MKTVIQPLDSIELMRNEFDTLYHEYFEYSHTEFAELTRDLKILFRNSALDNQTINRLAEELYVYLKHKGHFRKARKEVVISSLVRILKYAQRYQEPLTWHTGQENYANQLLSLYNEVKRIGAFEGKSQITLITRIISLIYGCTPVYNDRLCAFMSVYKENDLSLRLIQAYCKIVVPLFIFVLSILKYNLPQDSFSEETITMIEEMAHAIYDEDERRKNARYEAIDQIKSEKY